MFKDKLINIKNLLKIIISCFVIINMIKSCSMAVELSNKNRVMTDTDILTCCDVIMEKYGTMKDPISDWINWGNITYNQAMTNILSKQCFAYVVTKSGNNNYYYSAIKGFTKDFNGTPATNNLYGKYIYYISRNSSSGSRGYYYTSDSSYIVQTGTVYYVLYCDENRNLWEYSNSNFTVMDSLKPDFNFKFYDESHTAVVPNGNNDIAYCVFLDPLTDNQKIGYIENFEEHKNTQIQIFAQNYNNANNVKVNSIGEMNYYLNESGELFVNTNTMWTALVYEIVGIDNGPSGDFLNGQNFITYYYIAAGSNTSGDPLFNGYDANYENPQFFLWKLLGNFGDGSGDSGSGLFGGIGSFFTSLFIPSADSIQNFIDDRKIFIENHSGFFLKPSVAFVSILNKMYESGDFIIEIPTISIPR